jgi:predicted nucleic acid-binding protein
VSGGLFLVDSSAWIFAAGPGAVPEIQARVEFLIEREKVAMAWPVYFELMSFPMPEERAWKDDLGGLMFLPMEGGDWLEAADWTAGLRRRGYKVKSMDALIAFLAHKHRLTLLHADADMDRLARRAHIKVESYVQAAREFSGRK